MSAIQYRPECPCCGAAEARQLVSESYSDEPMVRYLAQQYEGRADSESLAGYAYQLVRCLQCGLVYQQVVPGDSLLSRLYEEWIPPTERERLHRQRPLDEYRYLAEQVQYVVRHFDRDPYDVRMLDFGMGWGEWAAMAQAFGCQVAGAELSAVRLQYARSIGIRVVSWEQIAEEGFDFINTEQVFEHLVDPLAVLKYLARSLRSKGVIRISVPDAKRALQLLNRGTEFADLSANDVMTVAPLEHINCFEHASLLQLAGKAGLQPMRPSLLQIYDSASGWFSLRRAARLALRPIYRHVFPKSTVAYFIKTDAQSAVAPALA
jgi:SAM-dependent methyltransferase